MSALRWLRTIAAVALIAAGGSTAQAADAFDDALERVYSQYRVALFKTNSGPAEEAAKATVSAASSWKELETRFAAAPPTAYAADGAFSETIKSITVVFGKSEAEVKAGQLAQAHEELEAVRDLLGELRHRNGRIDWHDHINAYHTAMEAVLTVKLTPDTLTPEAVDGLKEQVGVLTHLWGKLDTESPAAHRADAEFKSLIAANKAAIDAFRAALRSGDAGAIAKTAAALKPPYAKLFLKFG